MKYSKFKAKYLFNLFSILLTLSCFSFVIYQTEKCITKYQENPTSTHVTIAKASKHSYPDLTFCRQDSWPVITERLEKCDLTYFNYYNDYQWSGMGIENCTDPEKLYQNIVDQVTDVIQSIEITDFDKNTTQMDLKNDTLIRIEGWRTFAH